jgi:hypothetical protein
LAVIGAIALSLFEPVAFGQSSDTAASTPKQIRKAERKAARAKKNAKLKELQSQGYQPNDTLSYPQNIQNANKKVGTRPEGASAP